MANYWETELKVQVENIIGEDRWYKALTKIDKIANIKFEDEKEKDGFFRAIYTVYNDMDSDNIEDEVRDILRNIVNEWREEEDPEYIEYPWEIEYEALECDK